MTRGWGILTAAAFSATATWPSPIPYSSSSGSSSSVAWGFLSSTLPPATLSRAAASRRAVRSRRPRRCGALSAAATAAAAAAGERRESICGSGQRGLRMIAGGEGESFGPGQDNRQRAVPFPCRSRDSSCNSNRHIGRRTLALSGASYGGGDGGDGGLGRVGFDPESVARAREAAKNDDYDWFMEFIEGGEGGEGDGDDGGEVGPEDRRRGPVTAGAVNGIGGRSSSSSSSAGESGGRRRSPPKGGRRQGYESGDGRFSDSSSSRGSRYDPDFIEGSGAGAGVTEQRRRPPPTGRGFQPAGDGNGGEMRRRGRRTSAAADSAYDYDLDDEFDREPGRGGWDYDPGLSAGIGERRRDVQVDKVRAKTKPASMRLPLEDDQAATMGKGTGAPAGGAASEPAAVKFEPVDSEKAKVLVEDLGYTEPEVACMDPDMAGLAIERAIRRPASGMPPDWVAVGMPLPPSTPAAAAAPGMANPASTSPSSFSSQTYFGEGASAAAVGDAGFGSNGAVGGVDGGALDLDAILGEGFDDDNEDTGGGRSRRRGGSSRDRPGYPSGDRRGDLEQERRGRGEQGGDSRRGPAYFQDGGGRQQRREDGSGGGGYGYGYDDDADARDTESFYYPDEGAPRNGGRGRGYAREEREDPRDGGRRGRQTDAARGGQSAGRRRRRREEKEPEISAAERYEREVFGGLGGGAAGDNVGGGGGGLWGRDEEDEDAKLWTGVGPDGPWPTMEEFTKLLREETEVRLGLVGPWAAEVVSVENRFRLQAYEKWLEVLDKGIGATLEEAGVFDAAFSADDDDDYGDDYDEGRGRDGTSGRGYSPGSSSNNNLYDKYTNYGYRTGRDGGGRRDDGRGGGGGGEGYGYDPQGRQDERGFDYDDRYGGRGGSYRQQPRRPRPPGKQKFDVGSFLRSGAQNIMQPGVGMEDKAAEFERRYPGRTRSNALGYDDEGNAEGRSNVRSSSDQDFDSRRGQRSRREGGDGDDEPRGRRRGRGEDRGTWGQAGYQDEDDYEY